MLDHEDVKPAPAGRGLAPAVIIVGAGPVGLTLANLLGRHGVPTVLFERQTELEAEPRAVTLDDESLRTFQAAGLVDEVLADVVQGYGVRYFDWRGAPFASIQPTRQEYGYAKRNAFRQPRLVRTLLAGLARFEHVEARFGTEVLGVEAVAGGRQVSCRIRQPDGRETAVVADWLVACDGGRSRVREHCGITLEGSTYPERWLIVDLADRQVALRHTSTYCDPRRPAIRLPGPAGSLRYEFMLRPEDRDDQVLDEKSFRAWIGRRVPEDADLPLVRKAIYTFHARVASRWRQGRVLLAGDAAHLTPPFAGQGLNSGIRDAANLAWKLAAVSCWGWPESLIDSYEQERRPHAGALIRMALRIGAFMQPKSVPGALLAQSALRLACLLPPCRDHVLQLRFKPEPHFPQGWFERAQRHEQALLCPQPWVEHPRDGRVRLDAVLGEGFSVLGWDSPSFRAEAARWSPAGAPVRVLGLVRRDDDFLGSGPASPAVRVRDTDGSLEALLDRLGARAVVLRPDRYTFRVLPAAA